MVNLKNHIYILHLIKILESYTFKNSLTPIANSIDNSGKHDLKVK